MTILVIDGQGGNLGRQLIKLLSERFPQCELLAVGTNSIATSNMMKGGECMAATGENSVIVCCRKADIIIGPIGIVLADSLLGEITPAIAAAVGGSDATRILIPMNRCRTIVPGRDKTALTDLLEESMKIVERLLEEKE